MALETATYVDALVTSNPDGGDARNTADDHIRLIKAALKRSFPMVAGAVSASAVAITYVNDLNAPVQNQLNELRDGSATAKNAVNALNAVNATNAAAVGGIAAADVARVNYANVFAQPQFIKRDNPYLVFDDDLSPSDMARWMMQAYSSGGAGLFRFAALDDAGVVVREAFIATQTSSGETPVVTFQARPQVTGGATLLASTDSVDAASVGGVAAASVAKLTVAQSWSKGQAITQVNDTGTAFSPNCDDSTMFRYNLTGAATIANPANARSGMVISFHLFQLVGSSTVNWNAIYQFPGGSPPTLSTAINSCDVLAFQYDSNSGVWRQAGLNVTRI